MMKNRLAICALIAAFTLSACATTGVNYRPIVDTKNVDMNKFEADLGECRQYAAQTAGAAERAAAGAAAGAIFGALLDWPRLLVLETTAAQLPALALSVARLAVPQKAKRINATLFDAALQGVDIWSCNEITL
ncbi:hypothetical protein H8K52_06685 [Undibacterium seohonense]|uniref:Lipoprotein n=1 Tax=Undibacterium seohonense TaxID=1344950 RepID=A0ABR6X3V6_9BURK|nr:hypothetical protein [Undibacterium seohonense]MBC3807029.1 hypothetical protein [Undibacterium seohonense]